MTDPFDLEAEIAKRRRLIPLNGTLKDLFERIHAACCDMANEGMNPDTVLCHANSYVWERCKGTELAIPQGPVRFVADRWCHPWECRVVCSSHYDPFWQALDCSQESMERSRKGYNRADSGSSSGRTAGSDPADGGSNPSPEAKSGIV